MRALLLLLLSSAAGTSPQDANVWRLRAKVTTQTPLPTSPTLSLEDASLDCPGNPKLQLHIPSTSHPNEKKIGHFLVRYVPLVDGLVQFYRERNSVERCRMKLNPQLRKQIDAPSVFNYHVFTYIDHVKTWNCPGNFADVASFLDAESGALFDLGISRLFFVVLATRRQLASFYRLRNGTAGDRVRLVQSPVPLALAIPNPFQEPRRDSDEDGEAASVISTEQLPLCHLFFPNRSVGVVEVTGESDGRPLTIFEEVPLFTGQAVVTLKGISVIAAGLTLCVVTIVLCCLWACWLGERRQRRLTMYKGLHCPTQDYERSYVDLRQPPPAIYAVIDTLQRQKAADTLQRAKEDSALVEAEAEPLKR